MTQGGNEPTDVWTTYLAWGAEGAHAWYANGGDNDWTTVSRPGGFTNVGFLIGSGYAIHHR